MNINVKYKTVEVPIEEIVLVLSPEEAAYIRAFAAAPASTPSAWRTGARLYNKLDIVKNVRIDNYNKLFV
jgi:hypothetical protein